jgi:hypothetical protein
MIELEANMKRIYLSVLAAELIILVLFSLGCEESLVSLDSSKPPAWNDTLYTGSVRLVIPENTVIYSPGTAPEVSGYVDAFNYHQELLGNVRIYLCTNDSNVTIVYSDPVRQDTTNENGRMNFKLRCHDCAGQVNLTAQFMHWTAGLCLGGQSTILFQPEDRQPAYVITSVIPETLYTDFQHGDSTRIRIEVFDGHHQPVPHCNVDCWPVNPWPTYCSQVPQTDTEGVISSCYRVFYCIYGRVCYPFHVGAVQDSVCFTIMRWDSTHGG